MAETPTHSGNSASGHSGGEAGSGQPHAAAVKGKLNAKKGGVPVWGWVAIGGTVILIALYVRSRPKEPSREKMEGLQKEGGGLEQYGGEGAGGGGLGGNNPGTVNEQGAATAPDAAASEGHDSQNPEPAAINVFLGPLAAGGPPKKKATAHHAKTKTKTSNKTATARKAAKSRLDAKHRADENKRKEEQKRQAEKRAAAKRAQEAARRKREEEARERAAARRRGEEAARHRAEQEARQRAEQRAHARRRK